MSAFTTRGEKDPAKSGSSFPVESLRGSWPHSSHRRSSPNHQSIGSNWISVSDNSWGGFFYSLSFCSTCSKDPPVLNSLLIWKNIPRQFSFLVAKPSEATIWRLLVYLLLGPCCFLACSHFILLEWPSSGGQALPHLHIVTSKKSKSGPDPKNSKSGPDPKNPRGLDPKEKMNFPILQQASPLDQVLAKVCKSLNEVVCLTFCSLIPFYTEIPAVNIEWKILEIWIAGFLFSKVAHVTQAAGLRHMNNFCISASFPHTYTNIPGILSHCLPEVEQRNIAR